MEQLAGLYTPTSDIDLLQRSVIFRDLDVESLESLAVSLEHRSYLKGQLIQQPGLSQPPIVMIARGSALPYLSPGQ